MPDLAMPRQSLRILRAALEHPEHGDGKVSSLCRIGALLEHPALEDLDPSPEEARDLDADRSALRAWMAEERVLDLSDRDRDLVRACMRKAAEAKHLPPSAYAARLLCALGLDED